MRNAGVDGERGEVYIKRHVASEVRGCDESHNGRWENHRSGKGALTFKYPFILRSRANQR